MVEQNKSPPDRLREPMRSSRITTPLALTLIVAGGVGSGLLHHREFLKEQDAQKRLTTQTQTGPVYRVDLGVSPNVATRQDIDQLRQETREQISKVIEMLERDPPRPSRRVSNSGASLPQQIK